MLYAFQLTEPCVLQCAPGPTPQSCRPCASHQLKCAFDRPSKRRGVSLSGGVITRDIRYGRLTNPCSVCSPLPVLGRPLRDFISSSHPHMASSGACLRRGSITLSLMSLSSNIWLTITSKSYILCMTCWLSQLLTLEGIH
jgi:hypothetical protein